MILLDFSSSMSVATSIGSTNRPNFRNFTSSPASAPNVRRLAERKKMGRSEAAKKKELRENRQELVQKLLAGKVFCDMCWDGALSFML